MRRNEQSADYLNRKNERSTFFALKNKPFLFLFFYK